MSAARLLLDTQAVLDLAAGVSVPDKVFRLIQDPETENYLSMASLWEVAIKSSRNSSLVFNTTVEELHRLCTAGGIRTLHLSVSHLSAVQKLPWHHKDPFDRILIAQARTEGLTLVGKDVIFSKYDVPFFWD